METENEIAALRAEVVALRGEVATIRASLIASMPALRKAILEMLDRRIHTEVIGLEKEFNVALSINSRRAEPPDTMAEIEKLSHRCDRHAEHLARIETRLKAIR